MSQLPWYCTNGHHPIDNMQLQELNYPQTTDMTLKIRYWFCGRPIAAVEVLPRVPVHVGVSGPHDSYPGCVCAACPSRLNFLFLWFFIVLKVCVKTFISKFSISKSFVWSFLAPKFVLLQNYKPPSSFQNLSISKYSSPIFFTKFFYLEFSS